MTVMATRIRARTDLGIIIARGGYTRPKLAHTAGVGESTLESLVNPISHKRQGYARPVTAWKLARGWASLTGQTEEAAFNQLFIEEETTETK